MITSPPQHAGPRMRLTADFPISSMVSPDLAAFEFPSVALQSSQQGLQKQRALTVGIIPKQIGDDLGAYFGEVEHAFRGCGTRIPAKWNARRSAATLSGRSLPFGSRWAPEILPVPP